MTKPKVHAEADAWVLEAEQWFARPIEEVFAFFSDAFNLQRITPDFLSFSIVEPPPIAMFEGQQINYRLKLHGLPIRWRTVITRWDPPRCFIDEQTRGPYKLWRHTHTFTEHNGGTLMTDHVRYQPRGGRLINRLFVQRRVEQIFRHRQQALEGVFEA
jgi:ligand-binding SRPBCC domain-containing protein